MDGRDCPLGGGCQVSALKVAIRTEGEMVQWREATIAVGLKLIAQVTGGTIIGTERFDPSDLEGGTQ